VEIIAKDGDESCLLRVDLEKEILSGGSGPVLKPGDEIRVLLRQPKLGGTVAGVLRNALGASRDLLNLFIIYDVVTNND